MKHTEISELENRVRRLFLQAQEQRGGVRRISRTLQGALDLLRERYTALLQKTQREGWEQWLSDNFYALEGHAKQALQDLRGYKKGGKQLLAFYWLLDDIFTDGKTALSQQSVEEVVEAVNAISELCEQQFDFLYCALKCTLIFAAANACSQTMPPEERERLISYAVTGLSAVYELDFDAITRNSSTVERILLQDPCGAYPKMAVQSRCYYRAVTARLAKRSGKAESAVAADVLDCAQKAQEERARHVGYYLLSHDPQAYAAKKRGIAALTVSYLLPVALCLLIWVFSSSLSAALLCYLPLIEITRIFAFDLALRGIPAGHIPRMELKEQAPKTVIAISTLLPDASKAAELRTRLEQLYFSNQDDNLYFCVLADFKEDKRPYNPQDDVNIRASRQIIEQMNRQYGTRFMLFIRKRSYNKTQNTYSGWERKRGAITEFVRFLKGGETSVLCFAGDREALPELRYLIALDSDTNLSFQSANKLVSAAVHPLNTPVIGKHNIVTEGYGVFVPCMETELSSAKATDFTRLMAGVGGISTYEQECCDFYQDLFGEAIFSGKGLIDIDAFHTVAGRRFPESAVLSHDILEGAFLRVALVSDVEMTDCVPMNAFSWFTRLHRWLRGDWQNLRFLGKTFTLHGVKRPNPINGLSRYKLIDNLRRSLIPVAAVGCVICACFMEQYTALLLCGIAFFSISLAPLLAGLHSLVSGGSFALARRFFTRTLPRVFELFGQGLFAFVMTAQQAVITVDAILRTLWRMLISKKNLLQWTTAAQGELREINFWGALRRCWISELLGLCLLTFAPRSYLLVKLCGMLFLLYLPIAVMTSRTVPDRKNIPNRHQRERLMSWCAQMFSYYEDYANEQNHFLPPDNIQFSPREAVARRTSPTNIGMMLLSMLAARDFHFIDSAGLYLRLSRTLDTIESLKTYHGNLYNWYATDNLRVLPDDFVSSVDSGNYLCALVALKEGLHEYAAQEPRLRETIERIERILQETDFSIFYNKTRKLLSIGIDKDGNSSGSHYDFLMSEARAAGYFAIATRQAGYKHWRALNRTMSRCGVYAGPVSWTGTMFEYFMPHLLLPVYDGSLLGEALHYALYCQKRRVHHAGIPWGISESGYFSFDEHMNYQYKAHGVQWLGVKQGLDRSCVVSPYSTFLTLSFDLDGGMRNLKRLEELGMVGRYGFYEAIDFTTARRPRTGEGAMVRSYMAHHVGMSMIACANALSDNVMQKRFMRDHSMRSAKEFLQEKISKDTVVYDQMKPQQAEEQPMPKVYMAEYPQPSASSPNCSMLSNGTLTHIFSDTGMSWLRYSDTDVTRRSLDPLGAAQGVLAVVKMCGETLTSTQTPFYQRGVEHRCTFSQDSVTYHAHKGEVSIRQRFTIDRGLPVERCSLTLRNSSAIKAVAEVLFYFEPVLSRQSEYAAHPAFSKLFMLGAQDSATHLICFSRRHRDGSDGLHLSVGFEKPCRYEFALKREEITPYPNGIEHLLDFDRQEFTGGTATPDGCCALRLTVTVPPRGEHTVSLLLSVADTPQQSVGNLICAAERTVEPCYAPLMNDTMTGRLGMQLLSQLLLGAPDGEENLLALAENERGQDALWTLGISGDLPIVLYEWECNPDTACLDSYIELWRILRQYRLDFDLCILHEGTLPFSLPAGVHQVGLQTEQEVLTALRAAACHIAGGTESEVPPTYQPEQIFQVIPAEIPQGEDRFDVVGGAYLGERFYVDRTTPLPFSHILANPTFGTLLNDAGLGNSWWYNARECKLSPWSNDIASGNRGERLLLSIGGVIYDLCCGARASFSAQDARYEGEADGILTEVTVEVSKIDGQKSLEVTVENTKSEEVEVICAYYIEPVLAVSRMTAKYTQFEQVQGCLLMHNPYNTTLHCYAAICAEGEHPSYTVNRAAFLAGDWSASELLPNHDPIAGTIVRKRLPPRRRERIRFILSAAESRTRAVELACYPPSEPPKITARTIRISTPDMPLNCFINTFAPHQILAGRIQGRCAFYQCSGAYGFRDQLQDAGAYLLLDPQITRAQLLRCCAVQFEEGDVLHWWHALPGVTRGVRTTFSDDLLWLPYIVCDYVKATGDKAILDERVAFCKGEQLADGEQERYQQVYPSQECETVFQHCVRAIDRAYNLGDKGIPKIGCGDWNDGFSNVGVRGKGQSVWMGMFLAIVLDRFAPLCDCRGDTYRAGIYRGNAAVLRDRIDDVCWDGRWYLRAFYDDGSPIGSHLSDECRIDLLSQSFAVLAKMPDGRRVDSALDSALEYLVDWENGIIKLFAPPFESTAHNPGYIKAYPTGIRENGGQYTHASIWLAIALLEAGRTEDGWDLLNMLNPTARCTDAALAEAFKTEPYYIPADIYTHKDAYGHGGWSIYTGAAAWYYRAVIEHLLGIRFCDGQLELTPAIPEKWARFDATIDCGSYLITLEVIRTGKQELFVDDVAHTQIPLDGKNHKVLLTI